MRKQLDQFQNNNKRKAETMIDAVVKTPINTVDNLQSTKSFPLVNTSRLTESVFGFWSNKFEDTNKKTKN